MTHGDDFVITGLADRHNEHKNQIAGVHHQKNHHQSWVNRTHQCIKQKIALGNRGLVYQYDPRHVDVLVKDLGLEYGNAVQTSTIHDVTDEEPAPLDHMQSSQHRSQVARCLFLSQDRADVTFIANEFCHVMLNSTLQSLAKLKRPVRHLNSERQWRQIFS